MAEVSEHDLGVWRRADSGFEARMSGEGVSYLVATVGGVRYIAPLGSTAPPGVEAETVPPSEQMLGRMRGLGAATAEGIEATPDVPVDPIETFTERLRAQARAEIIEEQEALHRLGVDGYLAWWAENRPPSRRG